MGGTYKGTYHGGDDFAGSQNIGDIFAVHDTLKRQAAANQAAAGVNAGTSFLVYSYPAGGGAGPGTPGGVTVAARSPQPERSLIPNGEADFPERPTKSGPGTLGGSVGSGPGNRLVVTGPAFWSDNEPGPWFQGPKLDVGIQKGQDTRTSIKAGGVWLQPSPLFTDAEHFETRYGDDGPVSWLYQIGVAGADIANTADAMIGRPRASVNWSEAKKFFGPYAPTDVLAMPGDPGWKFYP